MGAIIVPPKLINPLPWHTYDQIAAKLPVTAKYLFGSGASGSAPVVPITNATDLAANFNQYEDITGRVVTGDSLHRWMPFSSGPNFVFGSDHLSLTATLDAGGKCTPTVTSQAVTAIINLNGGANTIANLGLADTSKVQVGQLVAIMWAGLYKVSAMVANTSITFLPMKGSRTTPQSWAQQPMCNFLPYYTATVTTAGTIAAGSPITCAGGVPAGIYAGMFYSILSGNDSLSSVPIAVVSTTGTTITLDTTVTVANGSVLMFTPPIRSAEMWTKSQFRGGLSGSDVLLAGKLTCQLPHTSGAGGPLVAGMTTASQYATLPPTSPGGAWPAWWGWSADDGSGSWLDNSEQDWLEFMYSGTQDGRTFTSGLIGPYANALFMQNVAALGVGGWYTPPSYFNFGADLSTAVHDFQFLWTRDARYSYVDGICIRADTWRWTSMRPLQIGLDLAIGSISSTFATNMFVPNNDLNFPQSFDIYSMELRAPN